MKAVVVLLLVLASLPVRAQSADPRATSTITLIPSVEELTRARHEEAVGRNLIIATAIMHGIGLTLSGISGFGVFGNREAFVAVNGVSAILGFTSLATIPTGIAYWTLGARHERRARAR